ncbi:MAG: cytochrome c3 family protein [Eggerthellaceae bacterium]|nr:cytochrome c3 family protein [Eggerthellaceae bacterium]
MSEEEAKKAGAPEGAEAKEPSPKRLTQKTRMVIGVVAAVVIVAAVGLFVWHEQPSFCSAICHTPMDPYLPTYEAEPGQASHDKWGNDVPDASGMMAATHRVEADADCMACHVPTLGEQVSEGFAWVSGGYEVINTGAYQNALMERSLSELTAARGVDQDQFCLGSGCHDMTRDELEELTSDRAFNPHSSAHGDVSCGTCHKAHRQSVMYCTKCHDAAEATMPEGWITFEQSQILERA